MAYKQLCAGLEITLVLRQHGNTMKQDMQQSKGSSGRPQTKAEYTFRVQSSGAPTPNPNGVGPEGLFVCGVSLNVRPTHQ